eukprot:scaffold25932_cov107-Isochrysis_galbana.AAC.4
MPASAATSPGALTFRRSLSSRMGGDGRCVATALMTTRIGNPGGGRGPFFQPLAWKAALSCVRQQVCA